jgi:hypothetical protein
MWGEIGERRYFASSGDGDDSAKGREEKSGKVVVLLKSGSGGMVIKLSQCGETPSAVETYCGYKQIVEDVLETENRIR